MIFRQPWNSELRKKHKKLEKKISSKTPGTLFEVNTDCAGGFDGQIFARIKQSATKTFLDNISKPKGYIDKIKEFASLFQVKRLENSFRSFQQLEYLSETENSRYREIFFHGLDNLAREILLASEGKDNIIILASHPDYLEPSEEDHKLMERIREISNGKKSVSAMSLQTFLSSLENGEYDTYDLRNTFTYNDFTKEDVEEAISKSRYANIDGFREMVDRCLKTADSFYTPDVDDLTGRNFAIDLNLKTENLDLVNPVIQSLDLRFSPAGKISLFGREVNLGSKVLKYSDENIHEGIAVRFYKRGLNHDNGEHFSELTIMRDLRAGKRFVLEERDEGEKFIQPIRLVQNDDGEVETIAAPLESIKKPLTVDVRIDYVYSPIERKLQPTFIYGRFNEVGKKNNIAQGGGIIEIKVVKDEMLKKLQRRQRAVMEQMTLKQSSDLLDAIKSELLEEGLTDKGKPTPFAPFSYYISESNISEIEKTAKEIGEKISKARGPILKNKKIRFALDFSINPNF